MRFSGLAFGFSSLSLNMDIEYLDPRFYSWKKKKNHTPKLPLNRILHIFRSPPQHAHPGPASHNPNTFISTNPPTHISLHVGRCCSKVFNLFLPFTFCLLALLPHISGCRQSRQTCKSSDSVSMQTFPDFTITYISPYFYSAPSPYNQYANCIICQGLPGLYSPRY